MYLEWEEVAAATQVSSAPRHMAMVRTCRRSPSNLRASPADQGSEGGPGGQQLLQQQLGLQGQATPQQARHHRPYILDRGSGNHRVSHTG